MTVNPWDVFGSLLGIALGCLICGAYMLICDWDRRDGALWAITALPALAFGLTSLGVLWAIGDQQTQKIKDTQMQTVRIGDKVRDIITGLEGIAIARTVWINGCVRLVVQPQEHKDGKPAEVSTFDEPQLIVLARETVRPEPEQTPQPETAFEPARRTGGPRNDAAANCR
jgi:hypothetical protein